MFSFISESDMQKEEIRKYLEVIKTQGKHDPEFVDLLAYSYLQEEEPHKTAEKVIELIEKRYDQDKENRT